MTMKKLGSMDTRQDKILILYKKEFARYSNARFAGIPLKGYLKKHNPQKDYRTAKTPIVKGFNGEEYCPPATAELIQHEQDQGWTGWRLPPGIIVIDNEDPDTMAEIDRICKDSRPPTQKTNRGKQWTFSCNGELRGADGVYTRSGLKVTYRLPMKNYAILPPTNGRTWEYEGDLETPPPLPEQLLPYRNDNKDDLLNCIAWEARRLKAAGTWGTYEELQGLSVFLIKVGISDDNIHNTFRIIFNKDYDPKKTSYFLERDHERIERGERVIGTGIFFESLKNKDLHILRRFALALEKLTVREQPPAETPEKIKPPSQAEKLIDIGSELSLFHDDMKEAYAELPGQNMKVRSGSFKQWLSKELWQRERKAPNSDALNQALNVLEAKANYDGNMRKLSNRIAMHEGALLYDLGTGRAVRVTPKRWEVVPNPPMIFKRYPHQQVQVEPKPGGELRNLFKYINVTDEDHRLLTQVLLISYLLPDMAHPILHPWGDQGSGKTTICKVFKLLIDPSKLEVFFTPHDRTETIQNLEHHHFIAFDNLSEMPVWFSDLLSQAVTGAGMSKRKLYTDDEDHVFQIKRCIAVNGINQLIYKPDAMDRSILIHHSRIEPEKRRDERALYAEFESERPYLLGTIFDVLAKAMDIFPKIRLPQLPRMADFALWGCAIAESLGHTQQDFLDAYSNNVKMQNSEIIGGNTLAQAVLTFMDDKEHWEGTVGEAFQELRDLVRSNDKDRTFPKAPNKLRKHLERIKPNLLEYGVRFVINDFHATKGVPITFQKIPKGSSVSSDLQGTSKAGDSPTEDKLNIPDVSSGSSGVSSPNKPINSHGSEHTEHTEDKEQTFWRSEGVAPEIDDPDSGGWES